MTLFCLSCNLTYDQDDAEDDGLCPRCRLLMKIMRVKNNE